MHPLLNDTIDKINNTTTIINNTINTTIASNYDDTLLWNEIAKLKATPPMAVYNNTTILPTTQTYQNKTIIEKDEVNIIPIIAISSIVGATCGIVTGVIYGFRIKRNSNG